ncbi:glycosyltransferase family 4 protein [Derxia gummosa]|uniref:Glycosyltransferase family 4 protein n=1 Tax=Derxia gummosa DSM 723 TaxID=1121388 RepID=A0A8B6X7M2_9BURK|nr:glycosyltransferase family 1 protein [Derxia gummosa]
MLFNGRFLTRPATGVDRFALELMTAYAGPPAAGSPGAAAPATGRAAPAGLAPARVAVPPGRLRVLPPALRERVFRVGSRGGQWWEQTALREAASDDVLVNLCNTGPLWRRRQLVVIHDAATFANPGNFSRAFRTWYRFLLGSLVQHSEAILTVSAFSAGELIRFLGRPAREIEVIPESGEHILREPADGSLGEQLGLGGGRPFVLAVGSQSPNKNFGAVAKAMALLGRDDVPLVAVGGANKRVFAGGEPAADERGVIRTGYVTDAQLRWFYEQALCFVFPSFYEGFGLPPLEAMCCGCPVIVSDASSLPEVCGSAALYCDPADPATLAAQLARLLDSAALRAEMAAAGRAHASRYTWAAVGERFGEIVARRFPM